MILCLFVFFCLSTTAHSPAIVRVHCVLVRDGMGTELWPCAAAAAAFVVVVVADALCHSDIP